MSTTALNSSSVEILGMRVDALCAEEVVDRIAGSAAGGWVLTPNLQHLRAHYRSGVVKNAFSRCELVVADGMPLVWATRLQGTPLPQRVAGSDLVWSLSEAAARRGRSLFLLGGSPGTADRAALELVRRNPTLRIAGTHCPPLGFEHSPRAMRDLKRSLERADPDIVYIGLPLGKQLVVMEALGRTLPSTWQVGLGVSFSFVTGDVRRAPTWLQRTGLEWLYRLTQEPRRLARRYLVEGLPFFAYLMVRTGASRIAGALPIFRRAA